MSTDSGNAEGPLEGPSYVSAAVDGRWMIEGPGAPLMIGVIEGPGAPLMFGVIEGRGAPLMIGVIEGRAAGSSGVAPLDV